MRNRYRSLQWFQQHPNGTAVIAIIIGFVFASLGSFDALDSITVGLSALVYYFTTNDGYSLNELVFSLIGLGICLPVLGWNFKLKKGAIWWPGWIVIPFLPFGWVISIFVGRPAVKVFYFGRPMTVTPSDKGIYDPKYWRGVRQAICWASIVVLIIIVVLAFTINDYPNEPLWVKIGQSSSIPYCIGGFLLYGALRK